MSVPFTPEQQRRDRAAATGCCSTAGAGSGKTSVLVERFVRACSRGRRGDVGADPRDHVHREGGGGAEDARPRAASPSSATTSAPARPRRAWISTIHGFCARLLRAHALAAGHRPAVRACSTSARGGAARRRRVRRGARGAGSSEHGRAALELIAAYRPGELRAAIVARCTASCAAAGRSEPALPPARPAPRGRGARARSRSPRAQAARRAGRRARRQDGRTRARGRRRVRARCWSVRSTRAPATRRARRRSSCRRNGAALADAALRRLPRGARRLRRRPARTSPRVPRPRAVRRAAARASRAATPRRKRARSALDFEDLELRAHAPAARARAAARAATPSASST